MTDIRTVVFDVRWQPNPKILIVSLGSLAASTPYLAAILMGIIGVWITSARSLGSMIKKFETEDDPTAGASNRKSPPKLAGAAQ